MNIEQKQKELFDLVPNDIKDMGARPVMLYLLLTSGWLDDSGDFIKGADLTDTQARFFV